MLKYLFIFSIFSIVGWIIEFAFRSINNKKIVNPGFMSGCVVPIYGFGALALNIMGNFFDKIECSNKIIIIFFISVFVLSLLELFSGVMAQKLFRIKLWDYSNNKFNYKGLICVKFSLLWGLFSLLFYYFVNPWLNEFIASIITNPIAIFFLGFYFGIFLIDLCLSINLLSRLNKYAKDLSKIINFEKLKSDILGRVTKNKVLNLAYPYFSTYKFLKDKTKNWKGKK